MSYEPVFESSAANSILSAGVRQARTTINHLNLTLDQANANVHKCNAIIYAQNDEIAHLRAEVAKFQKSAAEFRLQAIQKLAHAEGYKAMYGAMKIMHPESPMLADSGKRYKDRDVKTKARLLYEEAFDRIITNHEISNPQEYRAD